MRFVSIESTLGVPKPYSQPILKIHNSELVVRNHTCFRLFQSTQFSERAFADSMMKNGPFLTF